MKYSRKGSTQWYKQMSLAIAAARRALATEYDKAETPFKRQPDPVLKFNQRIKVKCISCNAGTDPNYRMWMTAPSIKDIAGSEGRYRLRSLDDKECPYCLKRSLVERVDDDDHGTFIITL